MTTASTAVSTAISPSVGAGPAAAGRPGSRRGGNRRGSGSRGPGLRSRRRGRAGTPWCRCPGCSAARPGTAGGGPGRAGAEGPGRGCGGRGAGAGGLVGGGHVQLADLERAGQPLLRRPPVQGVAHLVVPPLAGCDQVAVTEADQLLAPRGPGEAADRPEPGPFGVLDGVAVAPGDDGLAVAHRGAVDGQRLVQVLAHPAGGQLGDPGSGGRPGHRATASSVWSAGDAAGPGPPSGGVPSVSSTSSW